MKAVMTLPEDAAYGMGVCEAIRSVYPPIRFVSVYADLDRLSQKGYLQSKLGEPTATRGGRARKCYRVTALGRKVLEATHNVLFSPMSGTQQNDGFTPGRRRDGLPPKNQTPRPSPR